MRELAEFSPAEWARFAPLVYGFKELRNDLIQSLYLRKRAAGLDGFLRQTDALKDRVIACVIAFEQPWVLDWVIRMAARNFRDTALIVADNSRNRSMRTEIARVCAAHGVPCLALPTNRTRHVNRSHGMALSWMFHNVIRVLEPEIFGFFDHDLIPLEPIVLRETLGDQPLYGLRHERRWGWHLWAGYTLLRYQSVRGKALNFLYDFSRDLDTGGRNWDPLYRHYDPRALRFCEWHEVPMTAPGTRLVRDMQVIDGRWLHLRGVGYNDNFAAGADFFRIIERATSDGASLTQLLATPAR